MGKPKTTKRNSGHKRNSYDTFKNTTIKNTIDHRVMNLISGKSHDHKHIMLDYVFPEFNNLYKHQKPDSNELKCILSHCDSTTFSESAVIAEKFRLESDLPPIANELTFEIADISVQCGASSHALATTEHMIDYLFDETGSMILPNVQKKTYEVKLGDGQTKTIIYKVFDELLTKKYNHHFYNEVYPSVSEEEEKRLLKEEFRFKSITWAHEKDDIKLKNDYKLKDIFIIETLKYNSVSIDETQQIRNDTQLITKMHDMLKDRISGDPNDLKYLLGKRDFLLDLAMEVLKRLEKKMVLYSKTDDGKLKKRYIPLMMVLDKMILELMLVRKYIDLDDDMKSIKSALNKLGVSLINEVPNTRDYNKLTLGEFNRFNYKIHRTEYVRLIFSHSTIELPTITIKWLSYDSIIKKTKSKTKWYAIITTLKYLLPDEESREIYKKYIGGDPSVLDKLEVSEDYVDEDFNSCKVWIKTQKVKNALLKVPKILESPLTIIASIMGFLLTINELFKAYNDITKRI